jgi:hypothetical protein
MSDPKEILRWARLGVQEEIQKHEAEIQKLRSVLYKMARMGRQQPAPAATASAEPVKKPAPRRKRRLSAAGRLAISQGAQRRWAAHRANKDKNKK